MSIYESRRANGVRAVLLAGAMLLAAAGANAQFGRRDEDSSSTRGTRGLRATIETDRTSYDPDRGVTINLRLQNIGPRSVVVSQGNEYEITIREARSGSVVWEGPRSRQRRGSFRLEPGQTRNYREVWDQRDSRGRRVSPGAYRIEARIWPQERVSTQIYLSDRDGRGRDDRDYPGRYPIPRPFPRPFPGDRDVDDRYDRDRSGLRSDLRLDDTTIRPGEPINLTYTVTNSGSRSRTLRFSSGQQFDVVVRSRRTRRVVWRLSDDRMSTQALTQFTINPGDRRTFQASWRTDSNLEDGVYEVSAYLTPRDERSGALEATATVRIGTGEDRGTYRRGE